MKAFNKVAIVGVGLIGGSLALDLKKKRLARTIVGVSRHATSVAIAKRKGIIDAGSTKLAIIRDSDLIVLATPVDVIMSQANMIAKLSSPQCIVTDVGSTKEAVVKALHRTFRRFVGSHPLAGSERRGVANARPGLFKGSLSILTPVADTQKSALETIKLLWEMTGATVTVMSPEKHDEILAYVSHLPHLAAFSLIKSIPKKYLPFAPSSLKDTTRIAASDPTLWTQILLSNRKVGHSIKILQRTMQTLREAIEHKDSRTLMRLLAQAKATRDTLR